jgi:hypothetical protein
MVKLFIEIDLGAGYRFAGIATSDQSASRVDDLAQQLGGDPPTLPPASQETLEASSETPLCGVLDENAVIALGLQIPEIDVQSAAQSAKRMRWSGLRVRALIA